MEGKASHRVQRFHKALGVFVPEEVGAIDHGEKMGDGGAQSEAPEGATIEEVTTTPQKCSTSKPRVGDRKAANLEATDVATKPSQPAPARKKTEVPDDELAARKKAKKDSALGVKPPATRSRSRAPRF